MCSAFKRSKYTEFSSWDQPCRAIWRNLSAVERTSIKRYFTLHLELIDQTRIAAVRRWTYDKENLPPEYCPSGPMAWEDNGCAKERSLSFTAPSTS